MRQGTLFGGVTRKPDDDLAAAEAVYQEYPKKVAKGQAIKAIRRALKMASPAELIDAVREYAAAVTDLDPQFIPYPATWFNGQKWLDDRREWTRHRERRQDDVDSKANRRIGANLAAIQRAIEAENNNNGVREDDGAPLRIETNRRGF